MSAPSPVRPPARKPLGVVTYRQSQGANVWPGRASSDQDCVRVRDGELVIFQELRGGDKIAVSAGGRDQVLTRAEWRALPVYEG